MRIEGFSRNASDLFKIATTIAGFPTGRLIQQINLRCPARASVADVERAMGIVAHEMEHEPHFYKVIVRTSHIDPRTGATAYTRYAVDGFVSREEAVAYGEDVTETTEWTRTTYSVR